MITFFIHFHFHLYERERERWRRGEEIEITENILNPTFFDWGMTACWVDRNGLRVSQEERKMCMGKFMLQK